MASLSLGLGVNAVRRLPPLVPDIALNWETNSFRSGTETKATYEALTGYDATKVSIPLTLTSEDFVAWTAFGLTAGGQDQRLLTIGDGTYTHWLMLYLSTGTFFNTGSVGTGTNPALASTAGRNAELIAYRSGKFLVGAKDGNGTVLLGTEGAVVTMPVTNRFMPFTENGGTPFTGTKYGAYLKKGTFTDAQITSILTTA